MEKQKEEVKDTKKNIGKEIKQENKNTNRKSETRKDSKENPNKEKKPQDNKNKEKVVKKDNKKNNPKKEEKKQKENKKDNKKAKKISENNTEIEKENDLTFKKVEVKKPPKHRLLKFILILVIILIGAYCVFFSRNFIILNNIYNQMCEIGSTTNYSYETVKKENDIETTKIKYYKKENVERVDIEDKNRKVSTITDFESNQVTTWYPEEKTASVYNTELTAKIHLPLEEGINNQQTRAFMGLTSIIYSEECNSKQCYVIMQVCSPKMMNSSQKTWIDKETGLVVKREYLNSTIEYNNVELNNVRNIDTPDLRTYKVEKED